VSRLESAVLPPAVHALLDGDDIDRKVGETILLLTTSDRGWPHVAMLSVGEVFSPAPDRVRLALWSGTETGQNLRRCGRATLAVVVDGGGHYVELTVDPASTPVVVGDQILDRFEGGVVRVLSDEVGYARLTSGITFDLPDRDGVVTRWRATVDALR
jgi:hypothetical protein